MSQAMQYNAQVAMIRHPQFLRTAESLKPALHSEYREPQAIIDAHADASAPFGWQAVELCTPQQ